MKKIILSLSFVLLFLVSFSQAPGYMGKNWSVNYNASGLFRNYSMRGILETEKITYSPVHALNVSYTSSLKYMWAFEFSMTDFMIEDYIQDGYRYDIVGVESNYGVSLKIFNSPWIAPVGKYQKIGIYRSSYAGGIVSGEYDDFNGGSSFKFIYGKGVNYVFFNRVLFNIGIDFQLDPGLLLNKDISLDPFSGETFAPNMYHALGDFILLNFGIGILI